MVDATSRILANCWDDIQRHGPHVQAQVLRVLGPHVPAADCAALFAHRVRLVLARAGASADADTIGLGRLGVVRAATGLCPAVAPPVRKMACNAWALRPHIGRCAHVARSLHPLRWPSRHCFPRPEWPDEHCVGATEGALRLRALAIGVAWNAIVAGAARRGSTLGACVACVPAISLRPLCAASTLDAYR